MFYLIHYDLYMATHSKVRLRHFRKLMLMLQAYHAADNSEEEEEEEEEVNSSEQHSDSDGGGEVNGERHDGRPPPPPPKQSSGTTLQSFRYLLFPALPDGALVSWLPDGYSRIFRIVCVWPFRLLDYGSATLRCKI